MDHKCQHLQIVDLIIMNFKRVVHGLNPCAVPCEPVRHNNGMTEAKQKRKETIEEDKWILPKDHVVRKPRDVEGKVRCNEIENVNENRYPERYEDDLNDEKDEGCHLR